MGQKLRCIIPSDADTWTVFEFEGERLEKIQQVNLELHQRELRAMPTDILRRLSQLCFNDMRVIFLVHDKRVLSIILQELDALVHCHKVLTPTQAEILREGISTTLLPAFPKTSRLMQDCHSNPNLKDSFILKPIRSGKGIGILFGDELSSEDWQTRLEGCKHATISSGQTSYIV